MPRLRRADLDAPGITRRRRGRGFSYIGTTGRPVGAAVRERVDGLAIPPAWRQVWISPDELSHIQVVGTDDAGRRQYVYHPQWSQQQADAKYERVVALAARLPSVRRQITRDLRSAGLTSRRVVAGALRMLDSGAFRTGGEEYAEEYDTHGVATLLRHHAAVRGGAVRFTFAAKAGRTETSPCGTATWPPWSQGCAGPEPAPSDCSASDPRWGTPGRSCRPKR